MGNKIAIVTDSNSGITQSEAKELNVFVIPMPFMIDSEEYFEEINLSQEEFYHKLLNDCDILTSQPSPDAVLTLWENLLMDYDEIVYIPMSSGLSSSFQTARMLAEDYDGKVEVVNNQRISVTLRQSVLDAIKLKESGLSAKEIRRKLEDDKFNSSIYITVATLDYLKKGGRLTPAAALLGSILKIKPVLQIQGEKLDTFSKVRTMGQAKEVMINQALKDITERFGGTETGKGVSLAIAYTYDRVSAEEFYKEVKERFPDAPIYMDHLSLSVSCHIGPGSLAIAITKKSFE